MELWKLPPIKGQQIVSARNDPPDNMSINEKVAWVEGFDAGLSLFLTMGECLGELKDICEHNWMDVSNEVIESGEWCSQCGEIREAT